jgi:hypothetical protein
MGPIGTDAAGLIRTALDYPQSYPQISLACYDFLWSIPVIELRFDLAQGRFGAAGFQDYPEADA